MNRHTLVQGPLFDLLVERIASLFNSYSSEELRKVHLDSAPGEVVDLDFFIHAWAPQSNGWEPRMLEPLLAALPQNIPLAIYGRGPNWLYGALAMQVRAQPFYQFDSRLGWVTPPPLQLGNSPKSEVVITLNGYEHLTVLTVRTLNDHLDYTQASYLSFPPVSAEKGLILSGKLPLWLVTALLRLYNGIGIPWIACYHPQLEGAVVVVSHTGTYAIGDIIALPTMA